VIADEASMIGSTPYFAKTIDADPPKKQDFIILEMNLQLASVDVGLFGDICSTQQHSLNCFTRKA
jgi:hypothetical protein